MKSTILALTLLAFLRLSAFGQAQAAQQGTNQAPSPGATAAVYEAVARYQISNWQLGAHVYCYRVLGSDADKQFLDRLKPLPVKPESECVQKDNKNFTFSIVDRHSKKSAVMFGLGAIAWRSPTEAEVEGSYLCGSQCMAGGIYHVTDEAGQWRVTKFDVRIGQ